MTACQSNSSPRRYPHWARRVVDGFETYHVMNPYDDGIGLDEYVDWLIDAGYSIQRVADYPTWLRRFETAMRALPGQQRQASLLPLLHNYQRPEKPIRGSIAPTDRFRAAVQERENRAGQRHSAYRARDHRQVRHRPATARAAVTR